MQGPKIQLSAAETELMQDAGIILTKNRVLEKIRQLLQEVELLQLEFVSDRHLAQKLPFEVSPKISRGEQYLGLPWLILDYPRMALPGSLLFVRTMFWWGRFFSSTLHVSGEMAAEVRPALVENFNHLSSEYLGVNEDPWMHHFEADNYLPVGGMTKEEFEKRIGAHDHIKISRQWPLSEWEEMPGKLFEHWKFLLLQCKLIT